MAKQTINIGSGELAGDGESIRSAFGKINDNFDEIYAGGIGGGSGATGPQGPQGPQGVTGPTGPVGERAQEDRITTGSYSVILGSDGVVTLPNASTISSSDIGFSYTAPSNGPGGYSVSENSLTVGIPNPVWAASILANPGDYHLDFNGGPTGVAIGGISGPAPSTNVYTLTGIWPANAEGFPMTIASNIYVADLTTISSDNGLQVSTTGGSWTFGLDGTLTVPSQVTAQTGNQLALFYNRGEPVPGFDADVAALFLDGVGAIIEVTNSGTSHTWSFDPNGVLTLPSGNTRIGDVFGVGNDIILGSTDTSIGVIVQGLGAYSALQWVDNIENIGETGTQVAAVVVNPTFASSSGTVQIATGAINGPQPEHIWEFRPDGSLSIGNNTVHISTNGYNTAPANANTVIYTAKVSDLGSIRVHATIEGQEVGDTTGYHTQSCDMMIVRRISNLGVSTVDSVVYGVIYTSTGPLATLDAQWNALTSKIEITATPVSTTNSVFVKIYATEVARGD